MDEKIKKIAEALMILDDADILPEELDEVMEDLTMAKEILNSPEAEQIKSQIGGEITLESIADLIPLPEEGEESAEVIDEEQ